MTEIQLRHDFDVFMRLAAGDDQFICEMARTSTIGVEAFETAESAGLINKLMKERHGGPFGHGMMTLRITTIIAVLRELMRHNVGFVYSEQSGRYMKLDGVFYMPAEDRDLVQIGKAMDYNFVPGTEEQYDLVRDMLLESYTTAWDAYERLLDEGIAKEVARMVLPVGTYSTLYVSANPRAWMNFLTLRTKSEDSMFPSYPQKEINMVADQVEVHFAEQWPLTHAAFVRNGRVAP